LSRTTPSPSRVGDDGAVYDVPGGRRRSTMRKARTLLLVTAWSGLSRAEEEAEQKVVGGLSAQEGLTLAGRVIGGDAPGGARVSTTSAPSSWGSST
jgi:hypothetical protein